MSQHGFDAINEPRIDAASAVRLAQLIEGLAVDDHGVPELAQGAEQGFPEAFRVAALHGGADEAFGKVSGMEFRRLFRLLGGAEDLLAEQHDDGMFQRGHARHHSDLGRTVHASPLSWCWAALKVRRVVGGGQ